MEAEMIVVLAMTAAFLGFCVWLQLQSRRAVANLDQQRAAGNDCRPEPGKK
jgi:hypothetical protein